MLIFLLTVMAGEPQWKDNAAAVSSDRISPTIKFHKVHSQRKLHERQEWVRRLQILFAPL